MPVAGTEPPGYNSDVSQPKQVTCKRDAALRVWYMSHHWPGKAIIAFYWTAQGGAWHNQQ